MSFLPKQACSSLNQSACRIKAKITANQPAFSDTPIKNSSTPERIIETALAAAETGHLVLSTLHTNSAAQSVDRIVDVFPEEQQQQIRTQLASTLEAIISQRLVPAIGGGRVPACEILLSTPAVRNVIREGNTHQVDNIITTSLEQGMFSLERDLVRLVREGFVELDDARKQTLKIEEFERLLR